jgi:hypothetical protein
MVTREDIGEKLLAVLERYDATERFLSNCNDGPTENDGYMVRSNKNNTLQLSYAFIWETSNEGLKFWEEIDRETDNLFY